MKIADIFKKSPSAASAGDTTADSSSSSAKKSGETYLQWGIRWAGQTNASNAALNTSLNVVVYQIKNEQGVDEQLQQQLQAQIKTDIESNEITLAAEKQKLADEQRKLSDCESEIDELNREKIRVQEEAGGKHNKIAKANLWIGGLILACITVYLIIFYSSASYSAFFKSFGEDTKIYEALFDAGAWSKSLSEGIPGFLFITLLPFLFMGLGFIIHMLEKRMQGFEKYSKTLVLYCITFIFDALLAYEISEKMYNLNKGLMDPSYSLPLAFQSPGFWIIIFCGFIAYIIWGLVFDFTMQCYEDLDERKMKLNEIDEKINTLKSKKQQIQNVISQIGQNIQNIGKEIHKLKSRLVTTVHIDYNIIKLELNNFFNGWVSYMKLSQKTNQEVQEARDVYQSYMSSLEKIINSTNDGNA